MGFCSHIEGVRCFNCAGDPWQPPILAQYAGTFAMLSEADREDAFQRGAAVAFGLMAMAEAIRENESARCGLCAGVWVHADDCVMRQCLECLAQKNGASAFCVDCDPYMNPKAT